MQYHSGCKSVRRSFLQPTIQNAIGGTIAPNRGLVIPRPVNQNSGSGAGTLLLGSLASVGGAVARSTETPELRLPLGIRDYGQLLTLDLAGLSTK